MTFSVVNYIYILNNNVNTINLAKHYDINLKKEMYKQVYYVAEIVSCVI